MPELPVEVVKMLSVPLSRTKQISLEHDFETYADATNFAIKAIYKKGIGSKAKARRVLHDIIIDRFMLRSPGDDSSVTPEAFGKRFEFSVVSRFVPQQYAVKTHHGKIQKTRTPEEIRSEFVRMFAEQYVNDVIKSAAVEITKHRRLAKVLVNVRGKVPHFRRNVMILSGMLIDVSENAVEILSLTGDKIPVPFDKRSRNSEKDTLLAIKKGHKSLERVRLTRHREGFLGIDLRIH